MTRQGHALYEKITLKNERIGNIACEYLMCIVTGALGFTKKCY